MRSNESIIEEPVLVWLEESGYAVLHGPDIALGAFGVECFVRESSP